MDNQNNADPNIPIEVQFHNVTSSIFRYFKGDISLAYHPFVCIFSEALRLLVMRRLIDPEDEAKHVYVDERMYWNDQLFGRYIWYITNTYNSTGEAYDNLHSMSRSWERDGTHLKATLKVIDNIMKTTDRKSINLREEPFIPTQSIFSMFKAIGVNIDEYKDKFRNLIFMAKKIAIADRSALKYDRVIENGKPAVHTSRSGVKRQLVTERYYMPFYEQGLEFASIVAKMIVSKLGETTVSGKGNGYDKDSVIEEDYESLTKLAPISESESEENLGWIDPSGNPGWRERQIIDNLTERGVLSTISREGMVSVNYKSGLVRKYKIEEYGNEYLLPKLDTSGTRYGKGRFVIPGEYKKDVRKSETNEGNLEFVTGPAQGFEYFANNEVEWADMPKTWHYLQQEELGYSHLKGDVNYVFEPFHVLFMEMIDIIIMKDIVKRSTVPCAAIHFIKECKSWNQENMASYLSYLDQPLYGFGFQHLNSQNEQMRFGYGYLMNRIEKVLSTGFQDLITFDELKSVREEAIARSEAEARRRRLEEARQQPMPVDNEPLVIPNEESDEESEEEIEEESEEEEENHSESDESYVPSESEEDDDYPEIGSSINIKKMAKSTSLISVDPENSENIPRVSKYDLSKPEIMREVSNFFMGYIIEMRFYILNTRRYIPEVIESVRSGGGFPKELVDNYRNKMLNLLMQVMADANELNINKDDKIASFKKYFVVSSKTPNHVMSATYGHLWESCYKYSAAMTTTVHDYRKRYIFGKYDEVVKPYTVYEYGKSSSHQGFKKIRNRNLTVKHIVKIYNYIQNEQTGEYTIEKDANGEDMWEGMKVIFEDDTHIFIKKEKWEEYERNNAEYQTDIDRAMKILRWKRETGGTLKDFFQKEEDDKIRFFEEEAKEVAKMKEEADKVGRARKTENTERWNRWTDEFIQDKKETWTKEEILKQIRRWKVEERYSEEEFDNKEMNVIKSFEDKAMETMNELINESRKREQLEEAEMEKKKRRRMESLIRSKNQMTNAYAQKDISQRVSEFISKYSKSGRSDNDKVLALSEISTDQKDLSIKQEAKKLRRMLQMMQISKKE